MVSLNANQSNKCHDTVRCTCITVLQIKILKLEEFNFNHIRFSGVLQYQIRHGRTETDLHQIQWSQMPKESNLNRIRFSGIVK